MPGARVNHHLGWNAATLQGVVEFTTLPNGNSLASLRLFFSQIHLFSNGNRYTLRKTWNRAPGVCRPVYVERAILPETHPIDTDLPVSAGVFGIGVDVIDDDQGLYIRRDGH